MEEWYNQFRLVLTDKVPHPALRLPHAGSEQARESFECLLDTQQNILLRPAVSVAAGGDDHVVEIHVEDPASSQSPDFSDPGTGQVQ